MKKSFLSISVFFLFIIVSAQNVEVIYSKAYKSKDDSTNSPRIFNGIDYKLSINKTKSLMKYIPSMESDNSINKRFIGKGGGMGVYFKDIESKVRIWEKNAHGELVTIKMPYHNFDWELKSEYKIISGYKCYKAVAEYEEYSSVSEISLKKTIVVWYAPEINLPFGPLNRDGLPGLVLETSSNGIYFIATKINFKKNKQKVIKKPNSGRLINEKEYLDSYNVVYDLIKKKMKGKKNN